MKPLNLKINSKDNNYYNYKNCIKSKYIPETASQSNKESSPVACMFIRESIWFSVAGKDAVGIGGPPPVPLTYFFSLHTFDLTVFFAIFPFFP